MTEYAGVGTVRACRRSVYGGMRVARVHRSRGLNERKIEAMPPLVVDLDGTLTPTDTLWESVAQLLRDRPIFALLLPAWLLGGRQGFKAQIAKRVDLDLASLPWNEELLGYLRCQRDAGRRLVLATAANEKVAIAVSRHLGLFDDVIGSDAGVNLKGLAKLEVIRSRVGGRFAYAGDSAADVPIWQASQGAILVGVAPAVRKRIGATVPIEQNFEGQAMDSRAWLKALRVHQWVKNALLFVPLLTAFSFTDPAKVLAVMLAFVAFSLVASATYLVNDMLDLRSDRAHPRKRLRMLACARLSLPTAAAASLGLLALGFAIALAASLGFAGLLLVYLVLTMSYSLVLKHYVLLDVMGLASLYTLRIVAGAVTIAVVLSPWLLAFSMFIFLCLALVKRCAELVTLVGRGQPATRGRDYRVADLVVLWPLGVGSALVAALVFGLFIMAPDTQARFASPLLLWGVVMALVYWLARLWIKTARGEMHDDPVVYALTDAGSRWVVAGIVALFVAARLVNVPLP